MKQFLVAICAFSFRHSLARISPPRVTFTPLSQVQTWMKEVSEEFRFRMTSLNRYKDRIQGVIETSFEDFARDRLQIIENAQNELQKRLDLVNSVYSTASDSLERQRRALEELNALKFPEVKIYDSLEQFRNMFNESFFYPVLIEYGRTTRKPFLKRSDSAESKTSVDELSRKLQMQWELLLTSISDQSLLRDKAFSKFKDDVMAFQASSNLKAKSFLEESKLNIAKTVSKRDLRMEGKSLQSQFDKLALEGAGWIDANLRSIEAVVKNLQENLSSTNSIYEELVNRKKKSIYYTSMNDYTLSKVLNLIDPKDPGWKLVRQHDGVSVYQKFSGGKFACVKGSRIVRGSPSEVLELLQDNSRAHEINGLCEPGSTRDVEVISEDTVVKWAKATPIFPFKTRDFCTLVHVRRLKDGTVVVLSRATEHPDAPVNPSLCRASIVLGASIIQPVEGRPRESRMTMVSQVDTGGILPPMIVNAMCSEGPIGFFNGVEQSIMKRSRPSRR